METPASLAISSNVMGKDPQFCGSDHRNIDPISLGVELYAESIQYKS
ncbi:hypothetical protein VF_A0944 [Aliivibrio fischeri ES114]|uniref:Uncharacterized protein n=2 Tax=Aliivibrio fischeri TaxID=668 RepID=Q5DYY3_ALIF1|nr:hypothetical protein VF_A0944 [Aliivibrio fischeri ES114]MUH95795.1 hypothetical protein [Aliivibrio fischeri]MUI54689.1 hypothetical protein [Aliivibrio fischeri]MUI62926.1 hypothetical protein [Aliivibrio fischeri]MUJ18996.1 hypothetical protein [Aliivibrio fischeri]